MCSYEELCNVQHVNEALPYRGGLVHVAVWGPARKQDVISTSTFLHSLLLDGHCRAWFPVRQVLDWDRGHFLAHCHLLDGRGLGRLVCLRDCYRAGRRGGGLRLRALLRALGWAATRRRFLCLGTVTTTFAVAAAALRAVPRVTPGALRVLLRLFCN